MISNLQYLHEKAIMNNSKRIDLLTEIVAEQKKQIAELKNHELIHAAQVQDEIDENGKLWGWIRWYSKYIGYWLKNVFGGYFSTKGKSSKQAYTFNIIESGDSSDAVPFSLNNDVFGSETYDLETATGSPFVFNEEGEAAEETELSDVVFDNTLKNNTINTVIDSIYSPKQKAVYQLVINASESGYILTKVNVGDTEYVPGASWSLWIHNAPVYTLPNAGKEKVALVLSECEKYIFCLVNLTVSAGVIYRIDSYNIEGNIPVHQEQVFSNSNPSNNEWGVDLLIPDTRVDEDGMLIGDAYIHSQIDTAGTITSHINYYDGSSKTENLALCMVFGVTNRRKSASIFLTFMASIRGVGFLANDQIGNRHECSLIT